MRGTIVKLDRGFPLVRAEDGREYRCEHAIALVKRKSGRAVIGDKVEIVLPGDHDKAIIEEILPRKNEFVRKDPTERVLPQVLAANFDLVLIVQPSNALNFKRLERELVLAHETGARVVVVLAKTDLLESSDEIEEIRREVKRFIGRNELVAISIVDGDGVGRVRELVGPETTAILIGKSGVGKSSLINYLAEEDIQETAAVRKTDGKGRHTTVSREMIALPGGGFIVDMPGVRGLGLWDADEGIETAFGDVEEYAAACRFDDCKHETEPGCAVQEAVAAGALSVERLSSYRDLKKEAEEMQKRREEAKRLRNRRGHPRRRS